MKLRHDPLRLFSASKTPVGLRTRIDFMGEHGASMAAERIAADMLVHQRADGSWGDTAGTIKALYDLQLLNPGGNLISRAGVRWLLEEHLPPMARRSTDDAPYNGLFFKVESYQSPVLNRMTGTPFTKGCSGFIKTGAALFLASAYGLKSHERLPPAFESLDRVIEVREGQWCSPSCSNNILQGYAAHPAAREGGAMRLAVRRLADAQRPSGDWPKFPFYPALFALSHCEGKAAESQVKLALQRCARTQGKDGGWGRADREHASYMVLCAMRNAGNEMGID
ncbi:MAG: hypothetical protein HZB92_04900 [Euryarchaeota archaeon]|nr:hypothetical protein [Euryarchaeota archaeon]